MTLHINYTSEDFPSHDMAMEMRKILLKETFQPDGLKITAGPSWSTKEMK